MIHPFAAALDRNADAERGRLIGEARAFWREAPFALAKSGGEGLGSLLRALDSRLSVARVAGRLRIRAMELDAWPTAEVVATEAPGDLPTSPGLPEGDHAQALAVARARTGVTLETARVRVGVTRGHLLAIAVEVPLDLTASSDTLQLAAETYVEVCLGDDLCDRWIVSIDVLRSPRQQSMLRVAGQAMGAETHPLAEMHGLVRRACRAILEGVPESWLSSTEHLWTALEIGEGGAVQPDRRHASTTCPEALKAALEGLPFDSQRFTRRPELLVWIAFEANPLRRDELRGLAERAVSEVPGCTLSGTGFGLSRDYLDVWMAAEPEQVRGACLSMSRRLGLPLSVGFYDSRLSGEPLTVLPEGAAPSSRH